MNFEKTWDHVRSVLMFTLGTGIMVYETVVEHTDRPWLLGVAMTLLGPTVARYAEVLIGRLQAPATPPAPPQPPQNPKGDE